MAEKRTMTMTTDLGRYPRERRQAAEQSAQKNENKIEKAQLRTKSKTPASRLTTGLATGRRSPAPASSSKLVYYSLLIIKYKKERYSIYLINLIIPDNIPPDNCSINFKF
jgi:hypothetical protein